MLACEYLALLGYRHVLGAPTAPRDEDDAESRAAAKQIDDARVFSALLDTEPKPMLRGALGALWLRPITWPDRVPGFVTWAGQQTLPKIIRARQLAIRWEGEGKAGRKHRDLSTADPLTLTVPMRGASGIDANSCPLALDAGFSVSTLEMSVAQRPALELLAIIGLELVPLVSFAPRECGFVADGVLWRFSVEARDGSYYHRWGELREADRSPEGKRRRELDRIVGGAS